jgi:hypothetical protein
MCKCVRVCCYVGSDWKYVKFLSTLESGKLTFKTVSVKGNRDTKINVQLKERKKGSENEGTKEVIFR